METINFLSVDAIMQQERLGSKNNALMPLPYSTSVNRRERIKETGKKFFGLCAVIGIIFLILSL